MGPFPRFLIANNCSRFFRKRIRSLKPKLARSGAFSSVGFAIYIAFCVFFWFAEMVSVFASVFLLLLGPGQFCFPGRWFWRFRWFRAASFLWGAWRCAPNFSYRD